uniref:hypothetical protein n=1 Tax=Candidatus Electronema sp. TaxID=2698783 RepID=UPI0040559FA0
MSYIVDFEKTIAIGRIDEKLILWFDEIGIEDVPIVGNINSCSVQHLTGKRVGAPHRFATIDSILPSNEPSLSFVQLIANGCLHVLRPEDVKNRAPPSCSKPLMSRQAV